MKRTNKYGLSYFEKGDFTSTVPEMQRWETLDNQLYALFEILGNGVISGWDIVQSSGLNISITPGKGHVSFVAVESINSVSLNMMANSTNYVYASLTADSYWTKSVSFHVELFENVNSNVLLIGIVTTGADTVTNINMDGKTNLGFVSLVNNAIKDHRHIGGTENPQQINLVTDVRGEISQENLPPLDASVIQTGTVDNNRLPLISHITGLSDKGSLTHSQLDSFVSGLIIDNQTKMGEIATVNLLQLILSLKHIYPDIDEFLLNEITIIPGITSDEYIDMVNTTATVDLRTHAEGGTHTIKGTQSSGITAHTKIWDSEQSFGDSVVDNVIINGDSVCLDTKENSLVIEDFSNISKWAIETKDLSEVPSSLVLNSPNGATVNIGGESVEIILRIKRDFSAQDWSKYNYLKFFINTSSVEHGDLYFYISDAKYGEQNSYVNVLNKNTPTINIDTYQNGWQEVTIDISSYNRSSINQIGFYVSTQSGWDTSKGFSLDINNIYLSSGNIYQNDGHLYLTFGSDFLYRFWRMRWDEIIPTDSLSFGVSLKVRTRIANTLEGLPLSVWSDYYDTSGYVIPIATGEMYKYIEIDFYFTASESLKRTATLKKAYLDFYAADVDNSFDYSTKEDWDNGYKSNIDTNSVNNAMTIYGSSNIGNIIYGSSGKIVNANESFIENSQISGTMLPRSTYQILNNLSPSFGTITAISNGSMGSLWICDTENDRVIEIDQAGNALRGFFGSYLVENIEGSNVSSSISSSNAISSSTSVEIELMQSIYNNKKGFLYLIFNRDLLESEVLSISNEYIKIGPNYFYLNGFVTSKVMAGFDHVLKIEINGADKTLLDYIVCQMPPSISIVTPYQYQKYSSASDITFKFSVFNFDLGSNSGENAIRITLDGAIINDIYSNVYIYSGLSDGTHTIRAQLLNGNGDLNTNIEAIAEETFIIGDIGNVPYLYMTSPRANQIYSSSPVQIEFILNNFPIVPNGQHLQYCIDGDFVFDHYSTGPILIDSLDTGKHSINIYLVDGNGNRLSYTYGYTTINFIVGTNSNAIPKVNINVGGKNVNGVVLISPLLFTDVYSPFDIQYISFENSINNPSSKESILIGKLTNNYVINKLGV